ncbi:dihydrodipicolinate synthase family protein [Desulfovibrio intestinalis]|uniref:4-hydroxy-tetrahydrodipicolinate synthase n=1 Tax=Desulfovibrio intestinalis TaxID=58621 RepID=A0A7W8C254_9BACT|nr:dihydrodipicolinate synthase family protein [Desulfovibrio intestinalis]MBB5142989.1 4-hydroxy-tetrahydrodipicolinate synthase [Desulfovibrio intestinalis]
MNNIHGIFAVTVTHFNQDGSIDYSAISNHIQWLLKSGVHGIMPVGATGEWPALSIDERKKVAEFTMKEVNGKVPVIVGAISPNVDVSVELSKHAGSIGAAGVMILPPPGVHPSQHEIYEFYKYLSTQSPLPVMVYNNPGSCGVAVSPETLIKCAQLPNMGFLKESSGDIMRLTRSVDEVGDKLVVFCGCESLAYESFVMGAKAWVCVLANVAPAMCVKLYNLIVKEKNLDEARKVYRQMLPLLRLLEDTGELWQVVKHSLTLKGFGTGKLRLPRQPLSEGVRIELEKVLKQADFC